MTPGELLQGIQELLGGAANVLGTIINIKKDTLDPVMDTIDRAGEFAVQLSVSNTKKKSKLENHNGWLCKERIAWTLWWLYVNALRVTRERLWMPRFEIDSASS